MKNLLILAALGLLAAMPAAAHHEAKPQAPAGYLVFWMGSGKPVQSPDFWKKAFFSVNKLVLHN